MPDERIVLSYDPAEAIAAADKANKAIESNEKTASRAGLSIAKASDLQARSIASAAESGLAAIERIADSARRKLDMAIESGGAALALAKGGAALLVANGAQSVAAEKLVIAYRALRLALSPTIFTGMTLAAGAAVQALLKLGLAQADLVAEQAKGSVFAKQSFEEYRLTSLAIEKLGDSTTDYLAASQKLQTSLENLSNDSLKPFGVDLEMLRARGLKSTAMLREIGAAAEDLDSFEKARLAVKLFGEDAEKNIGFLDGKVSRVRESFVAWGGKLTEIEAKELLKFRHGVDSIGQAFDRLGDSFAGAIGGIETRLAVVVAGIHNTVAGLGTEIDEIKRVGKILSEDERRNERRRIAEGNRTPGEFREIAEGFTSNVLANRRPGVQDTAGETAARMAKEFDETLPGLQRALSKATAAREAALKLVGTVKGSLLGEGLLQEIAARKAEIASLTDTIKALGEAERRREEARKNIQSAYKELTFRQNTLATLSDPRVQKVDLLKEADLAPLNALYEKEFQKAQSAKEQTVQMELTNLREQLAQEEILYQGARDLQLQQVEGFQARSVAQKIAVEQRKAEIEKEFLLKNFALKAQLLQADQEIELAKAEQNAELRAAINQKYALAGRALTLQTEAAIAAAGNEAVVKTAQILQDRGQKAFDSVKNAADGLFDALVTRTRSWGDLLRNTVLLPALSILKQITSNTIASALTGVSPAGGGGQAGGILGKLGLSGIVSGGLARAGAPGGTPGFAGPVGGATGLSGMLGGGGGFGGGFGGGGAALGINAGALGLGAASLGLFGAFKAGQSGNKGLKVAAPAIGALSGLVGFGSLAYLFPSLLAAGPVGWVAAAAIGATVGLIGVFKKRGEDKLVEKIKAVYGITVDRSFAKNTLMPMIKDQFGGDIEVGIRSPIIRELLSVYRMQSNQSSLGAGLGAMNNVARGVSLTGTGGGVFQNAVNVNGNAYGYGGAIPSSGPVQPFQPAPTVSPVALTLQIDGRDVQAAVSRTNQSSNGRRETSAVLLEPLTIFG